MYVYDMCVCMCVCTCTFMCVCVCVCVCVCMEPTLAFLPVKSHGQWSLVGYSPWNCKRVRHNLVTKQQNIHTHMYSILAVYLTNLC